MGINSLATWAVFWNAFFCIMLRNENEETAGWYSLVIDVKCSWHTVADNMFSIINMIIIIIWQYSTYSCECVKRLFISLIKANCICSLFYWGWGCWWQQRKEGTGVRVRPGNTPPTGKRLTLLHRAWFMVCIILLQLWLSQPFGGTMKKADTIYSYSLDKTGIGTLLKIHCILSGGGQKTIE